MPWLIISLSLIAVILMLGFWGLGAAARTGDEQLENIESENWNWPDRVDDEALERYERWRAEQIWKELNV